LTEAARNGDSRALDQLLRQHYDRVFAVCRRMTGNDADAADATQEALIAIVRGLPRFDGRSRLSTWVYRIAVNAAIDEQRRRRRRPHVILDLWASASAAGASADGRSQDAGASTSIPPDREIEQVADRLDVDAALLRLPVEFRAPVVLRDLCGLDYAEIAEVLDLPAGTVRSRIWRGRAALVPMLSGNQVSAPDRPTARP
jgi:RNA polymerase sigma-70 factor (ECF subfamily)